MSLPRTRTPAFCGNPVSPFDLALMVEVVVDFGLPRSEMANTVCELLGWQRPSGKLKRVECLEVLEKLGCFVLPAPKNRNAAKPRKARRTEKGNQALEVEGDLKELHPIALVQVESRQQRDGWNELVDRHHYLGYRVPFGASLRYFIESAQGRVLGCMQWSSPSRRVQVRDRWIGWDESRRSRHLQRLVKIHAF